MMLSVRRVLIVACAAIAIVASVLFLFSPSPPADSAPAHQWLATGMGEKPSGQLTAGSCFTLTFSIPRGWVIINNQTGADAYYVPNDPGCAAGSSYYDHVLDDGEDAFYNGWLKVDHITVYITPTSGFTVTGW